LVIIAERAKTVGAYLHKYSFYKNEWINKVIITAGKNVNLADGRVHSNKKMTEKGTVDNFSMDLRHLGMVKNPPHDGGRRYSMATLPASCNHIFVLGDDS
jgi:hypothetical protein